MVASGSVAWMYLKVYVVTPKCLNMVLILPWLCCHFYIDSGDDCVVYSFGVANESTFEVEMVHRTNCQIYAYDFSVDGMQLPPDLPQELRDRIHFHKLGIQGKSRTGDDRFRTLKDIMAENGHTWIDFMKVGIKASSCVGLILLMMR